MSDHEDLVDYGLEDESPDQDMESVSGMAEQVSTSTIGTIALPTETEVLLAERVAELERERDALTARVKELERPNSSAGDENAPISIPPALVPVLALLRQHIRELTRENSALRYTFLGSHTPARQEVISLSVGATPPTTGDVSPATPLEPMSAGRTPLMDHKAVSTAPDVDLEAVLTRVKTLMLENEELGDLVAETGQASSDEWLKALEDSRAVIASLDSDLNENLTVVEKLRAELDGYKARFGSLDAHGHPHGQGQSQSHGQSHHDGRQRGGRGGGGARDVDRRNNGRRDGRDGYRPNHDDTHARDTRDGGRERNDRNDRNDRGDRDRGQARDGRDGQGRDGHRDGRDGPTANHRGGDRGDRSDRGERSDRSDRRWKDGPNANHRGGGDAGLQILGRATQDAKDDRAYKRRR
ncbi:hypothetical protein A1Q1_03679 [Trichosporon asahii var. asahii CBS 2479]|uniref:Uncharacterized protein n=1 Tax=Trichosporon asahii var. asahii (strain ATCC 90039 / CBS 2479 / JCM 2466 / KCTC 7840 / NBRC 103889/ NCYC 2677 / UAMH 7654) TaxID=1186058 RepID=J6FBQ5_TRIAS|nr:hypothetical protein A1Q1_03679 [Trichosporon asahii var. asahii CBS 2479]EJT52547.1 hypothetical protein A1Q1_03679 [Trichosporon asahii var. asahii CBS 2479]